VCELQVLITFQRLQPMTEDSFQAGRKVMQKANYLRGEITKQKSEVSKWTRIEDACRKEMKVEQADGAKKCLVNARERLDLVRKKFADLQFPDSNMKTQKPPLAQCESCGNPIPNTETYCSECTG
jgi:hypothetical protein